MTEQEISMNAAIAIISSPDPFFPEPMRKLAREKIKNEGSAEQKKILAREPAVRQINENRLSAMQNNSGRLSNLV